MNGFVLKGWHVGLLFAAFFASFIATDVVFASLAFRSFPGEVSTQPYEEGLAYNATLDRRARQAALGWTVTAESALTPDGRRRTLELRWTGKDGRPLGGLAVDASLGQPATGKGLRRLSFKEAAPGVYRADAPPLHGYWTLQFTGRRDPATSFEGGRRFVWP